MNEYNRAWITCIWDSKKKGYSKIDITTEEEYIKIAQEMNETGSRGGICEMVGDEKYQVKPYFDLDPKGEDFDKSIINQFIQDVKDVAKQYIGNDINHFKMKRKPREEGGVIRHSYRVYLEARITYFNIPVIFKSIFEKYESIIDDSVYSRNRRLYSVLNKRKQDLKVPTMRILNGTLLDGCASYIKEEYPDLDQYVKKVEKEPIKKVEYENDIYEDENEDVNKYNKISKLIRLLKSSRSDKYNTWSEMSWCLLNISKLSNIPRMKAYSLVHQFSQLSKDNYFEDKVDDWLEKNYDNLRDIGYGWRYMYETAIKNDNPEYYNKITKTYFNMKKEFELTHAKIMFPPHFVTLTSNGYELQTEDSFKKTFKHLNCCIKTTNKKGETDYETKAFIDKWLRDPEIRQYERLKFCPPIMKVKNNEFNVWEDYIVPDVSKDNDTRNYWEEYKQFGLNLIGNSDELNFVLARYALRIQNPSKRSNVCVVYYGKERIGKNRFLSVFKKILGKYYLDLDDAKKLYEKHALHEFQKILICVNEAQGSDNFSNADILKTRITEPDITVNPKGITPYTIDNYCDYDMTTNNYNCVKITDDSYKRFIQISCTDYYLENTEFFNDYVKNIENNPIAIRQIYEGLMNFDIDAIIPTGNFQNDKPITKMDKEVRYLNKDRILLFLEDLTREHIKRYYEDETKLNEPIMISNDTLFKTWCHWLQDNKFKNYDNLDKHKFGMKISKIQKDKLDDGTIIKDIKHSKTTISYTKLMKFFELNLADIDIAKFIDEE